MNNNQLPRATATQMGVEPAAIRSVVEEFCSRELGAHGLMILRHGSVIAEGWWKPYRAELTHMLFSLSKAFTSTAIGFAVQEKLLSLSDRLVDFFPERLPCRPCENMEKMTLKDMITMSTGHSIEPDLLVSTPDGSWQDVFLHSYVDMEPGSRFLYNTASTYMLSAVLQKVTGMTTEEYLTPRLFDPLGIESHRWEKCPEGITTGGYGLNITTESIAKFGTFLLNRGSYGGKQLLNPEWIDEASSFQVQNFGTKDWGAGYGYQFWRCVPDGVYRGDGAFGQYCLVLPKQDMVIAINSGSNDMQAEIDIIWEKLLPAVHDAPIPEDAQEEAALSALMAELSLPFPKGSATPGALAAEYSGRKLALSQNLFGLTDIQFDFGENKTVSLFFGEQGCTLPVGMGEWLEGKTGVPVEETGSHKGLIFEQAACAGGFEGDTLRFALAFNTTPFVMDVCARFDSKGLVLHIRQNVAFTPVEATMFGR